MPEPWLRGPLPGIPALLQPAGHALVMAQEEVELALSELTEEQLWLRPQGVTSVGFHVAHLAGSTDRLFTYARGEVLSEAQRTILEREATVDERRPSKDELLGVWRETVREALRLLGATPESTLTEPRLVGRAGLPSTVLGLLFHGAEHASRHTGQIVTTAKLVRGLR
ncbi:MAG: DinB family protein [Gemmatimonadetes bacterium]|nr:DinB family protein [Gemmatimonadota bacterium]MDA1103932.1 DinB family protein [Gemmatimonadota bacterium]